MTALIWILAVLIALILLFSAQVSVHVFYDSAADGASVKIRYLFFSYRIKSSEPGEAKEKAPGKKKPDKAKKIIRDFKSLWSMAKEILKKLGPGVVIKKLTVEICIGGEDAAQAAIRFGELNAAVFTGAAVLDQLAPIKKREIHIAPDFYHPDLTARFELSAGVRLYRLIWAGLFGAFRFIAAKKEARSRAPRAAGGQKNI